jgi:hypothetical protein
MDQGRSEVDGSATSGAEAFLPVQVFLSLYLVLLAFFIVLATVSRPETSRAVQAIASVRTSFPSDVPLGSVTGEATSLFVETERGLLDRVGRLVEADLPIAPIRRDPSAGQIVADIPLEMLFEGPAVAQAGRTLLGRAAALLASPPDGIAYGLTVTLPPDDAAIVRAGRLARALLEAGAPPAAVRAGVEPALTAVRFAFAVRPAGATP